jgi:hypothetical protein
MFERKNEQNAQTKQVPRPRFARRAFLVLCGVLVARGRASAQTSSRYLVIVHVDNRLAFVEREFLSDAFLKKRTTWHDGRRIQPVDLGRNASARKAFSLEVLRRSVDAVKAYWVQRIFSGGDVPPPELGSDVAVVEYVSQRTGAVGYVSPAAELAGTRVIPVR